MVHDSPLIVRDPTFWFLFATGFMWHGRAVSELRYAGFVFLLSFSGYWSTYGQRGGFWLLFCLPGARSACGMHAGGVFGWRR